MGKRIILFILAGIAAICVISCVASTYCLHVTKETYTTDRIFGNLRIVQISDLHNAEFGKGNQRLVKKIQEQEPDLILVTGDLLNLSEENTEIAVAFLEQIRQIAPVYVSYGNHEVDYESHFGIDLKALFEQTGVTVLRDEFVDVSVGGQEIRIGGCYGHCYPKEKQYGDENSGGTASYLYQFEETERFKILMTHIPTTWILCDTLETWDIDLVFTGHFHGGQIRFPLIGGVYAPDMGYFPGRLSGVYPTSDGKRWLIVSRGLGNTEKIPRMNNIPEIVVTDVCGLRK